VSSQSQPLAGWRIAHLTTIDTSLEYLLLPLLVAAKEAGAEVLGISAPGPSVPRLAARGIRHVTLSGSTRSWNLAADIRAAAALWRILRAERPDVLHTHTPKPAVYGRIVGRLAGVPVVVNTVHGLYATTDDSVLKRAVVYGLEAVAARFSDAELLESPEDLDLMRRLRLAPQRRLRLLGGGIDLSWFRPDAVPEMTRRRLRSELGISEATVVVGIVARLVHEKGYRELIAAAEAIQSDVTFVAVGGADLEKPDSLSAAEIERGQRAGIRFLGYREDLRDLYAAMDVFVLPSYREGLPRSLMEAAAMGKPLIATDIRGCRQIVVHGVNGLLVPARSSEHLAGAISEMANSPERRLEFGRASRCLAERKFDERIIAETVLSTYLANTRRPIRSVTRKIRGNQKCVNASRRPLREP
jgi:glycosyltransferase involved in cell wall biosynthesis